MGTSPAGHAPTYKESMILEGLVTTRDADGSPHLAPMGPWIAADWSNFELRPFPTSNTYRNLCAHPEGVLHVTDDAMLMARAAVGMAVPFPATQPAEQVQGHILTDACRAYEFRATKFDTTSQRVKITCEPVRVHRLRDFWGFNRARHAVLEAAILASRLHMLPADEVASEFHRLRVIVDKTGGDTETEAMTFLEDFRCRGGRS